MVEKRVRRRIGTIERIRALDSSLKSRALRVRSRSFAVVQATIAAGTSYWVATHLFGHQQAFFAPIAAIIILGLSGGAGRLKRAVEMSLGCTAGVGIGDVIIAQIGPGTWQITVAVALSLLAASFISKSPLVTNQIAIGSILIATIMPPGTAAGYERPVDAFIGGVVAILTFAIIPSSPLSSGRREVTTILGIASSVLHDVGEALPTLNAEAIDNALKAVRGTQTNINALLDAAKSARENTTISPLLWSWRRRVRSLERMLNPVDNMIRNSRVLARRALVLCEDGDSVSREQIALIGELADVALTLSELYEKHSDLSEAQEIPEVVKRLRQMGARAGTEVAGNRPLSAMALLAQTRSIIVDMLQVCGMRRESAVAVLAPTSATPAYPPEVWKENS
ncbi:aromatic acid exporter family protein [Corynebacterium poyangense]|uniref:Aromatic acid exporter family protein n=1 Tax=Corynebacterium poyangense TaxID=2684405 RepID=A0A7H0SRE1_9CORY|nr:FUSC family protein [Corynebacterium poyangense]MBZ8176550.1 aromatic acid exporter family protein [Corynebacterium poyangense]QNQ91116.1 aromatic acid exporter family protein [Corynebacterium poyangense]